MDPAGRECMRKYVYLFELDSVRKTDWEIRESQHALWDEIVKNGNIVVLTYNQLIDSRAFYSLLENPRYYESFLKLFEKGYIRISQFGDIRTIAQYLLSTIDGESNRFIYSALPIKSTQRRLIALIKRSITYSDLSEINEYIHRIHRTDGELMDLFVEVESCGGDKASALSLGEMEKVLKNLYGLLGMVLRLSTLHDVFVLPREPAEYANFRLKDYLGYICKIQTPPKEKERWCKALDALTQLGCWGTNNRSLYFHQLKALADTGTTDRQVLQYAEAIVSVCTNYAYEMSICNISKHYNVRDLWEKPSADSSFFKDFWSRLEQHWRSGEDAADRFLQGESNGFEAFVPDMGLIQDFEEAARILPPVEESGEGDPIPRYEARLHTQRRRQRLSLLKSVPRQILSLVFAMVLTVVFNVVFEVCHSLYSREYEIFFSWGTFWGFGFETILFLITGEFVTGKISHAIPRFLSLSEAAHGIVGVLQDTCRLLFRKANTYVSENSVWGREKRSQSRPVDFLEPEELKKYTQFYKDNPHLVTCAPEYPIADVTNRDKRKEIVRNRELFKHAYGVVYKSPFHTLVVDPIEGGSAGFYPYERIVPTAMKNGVVLLVLHQGKFVLLRQFRHAIRKAQLCCPRGFGEAGVDTAENAKKELQEELGAICAEAPVELGTVTGDSGLSWGSATVYLMKIDRYGKGKTEGIREIVEVTPEEMSRKIARGEIHDGYTLAALAMYRASNPGQRG